MIDKASEALKQYFGYDSFKSLQGEIINHIMEGNDALVLMPTGGGKSVCFQIPAIVMDGICIVISPLIALMKDQVDGLKANGVRAGFINSSQSGKEQSYVEMQAISGELDILYVSPEKMLTSSFIQTMSRLEINLFAIDEAHCISSWGHDFRPEYTKLRYLKEQFPNVPLVALTATADKLTRQDIIDRLNVDNCETFLASFDRPNLSLTVLPGRNRLQVIQEFIKERPGESGIIYCLSRRSTEDLTAKLQASGIDADFYHAGMSSLERTTTQESFIKDKTQIVCATIAFGMGIDKSNIRWVIHYNLPQNIEGYYQEIGRAGRDGLPSDTLLFYSYGDVKIFRDMFSESPLRDIKLQKLDRILQFAESFNCRRNILLNYFGENPKTTCGKCDVCKNPPNHFDGTVTCQKVLSCVARLRESEAMGMVVDVLRGSGRKEVFLKGYQNVKTYGIGREISIFDWQQYIAQMTNLGLLEIAYDQNSALRLTEASKAVLFENKKVDLVQLTSIKKRIEEQKKKSKPKSKTQQVKDDLFEKLRQLRKELANKEGIPPYLVFTDATLTEMVDFKPTSLMALRKVSGVGEYKLEKYGDEFAMLIRNFVLGKGKEGTVIKGATYLKTYELFQKGLNPDKIAKERELTVTTIFSHFVTLFNNGYEIDLMQFISEEEMNLIKQARSKVQNESSLKDIFAQLGEKVPYHKIRIASVLLDHDAGK